MPGPIDKKKDKQDSVHNNENNSIFFFKRYYFSFGRETETKRGKYNYYVMFKTLVDCDNQGKIW